MNSDRSWAGDPGISPSPFLSEWRGDETLYSWAAGYVQILGRNSAKSAGSLMFGRPQACRQYELPAGLQHFANWSGGRLGTLENLATSRTVLEEWWPFFGDVKRRQVIETLAADDAVTLRLKTGICASGAGSSRPLRYCPECRSLGLRDVGTSVWRMPHQRIGTLVCQVHSIPLHEFKPFQSEWMLPESAKGEEVPVSDAAMLDSATRLAFVNSAFCAATRPIEVQLLQRSAIQFLVELGIVRSSDWMVLDSLAAWFAGTETARLVEQQFGERFKLSGIGWLNALLRSRRVGHPLHWYVFWTAVTEGEPLDKVRTVVEGVIHCWPVAQGTQSLLWPELSDTAAFPDRVWDLMDHVPTHRALADSLGVPAGSVKRWINSHPDARQRWRENKVQRAFAAALETLREYLLTHPTATRTAFLKDCHAAASWMRANMPTELDRLLASIPTDRKSQKTLWT